MQSTADRLTTHRRPGLPRTGGSLPRRPAPPAAPAPVRRPLPCRVDPDLWFAETPAGLEEAKVRCTECPVRNACLAGALDRGEPWGVWGGEIFERGVVIPRKRPRGRPRKQKDPLPPTARRLAAGPCRGPDGDGETPTLAC